MLVKTKYIQYFAEGEDERKIIDVLKTRLCAIKPGKVLRLNVVEQEIKMMHLRTFICGTMVVLVFDTDTGKQDILMKNIKLLEECPSVSEIILIPQVPNLEGELIFSCNIKKIEDLLNSKSGRDFKRDLIRTSNLDRKLLEHQFSISRFWSRNPTWPNLDIKNQAAKIKLMKQQRV